MRKGLLARVVAPGPAGVWVIGLHDDGHLVARDLDGFIHAGQRLPGSWPQGGGCGGSRPPVTMLL